MGSDTTRQRNGNDNVSHMLAKTHNSGRMGRIGKGGFTGTGAHGKGFPYIRTVPSSFKQLSNGFGIRNFRACEMTLLVSVTRYSGRFSLLRTLFRGLLPCVLDKVFGSR